MARIYYIVTLLFAISAALAAQNERGMARKGNKLYHSEKFNDAEIMYRKALEEKPGLDGAKYNLAASLYKQQKFEEAAAEYNSLIATAKDKEELATYYHNLGNALMQAQKLPESVEAYKMALRNNPGDEQTRYNLAFALDKLQQQQQQQNQQQEQQDKGDKEQDGDKQQQQQQDQKQQQQDQKQQGQEHKISKEDAKKILDALQNQEREVQERLKKEQMKAPKTPVDKDW